MSKIKIFIIKVFYRLFPHVRNIHFSTDDGVASVSHAVDGSTVMFFFLNKPMSRVDFIKECPTLGDALKNKIISRGRSRVDLCFYTPDSIDRFIESLKKAKLNLELQTAGKILANGGTMEWKWDKEIPSVLKDYERYKAYTATIEFKMPEDKPKE